MSLRRELVLSPFQREKEREREKEERETKTLGAPSDRRHADVVALSSNQHHSGTQVTAS